MESRSQQKRKAIQRGEAMPTFEPRNPSSEAGLPDLARELSKDLEFADSGSQLELDIIAATLKTALRNHSVHVQRFLTEMYQVMVDPIEDFDGNIEQLCALLIERAKQDRAALAKEARDAGAREEPISGVEFNLRYGHQVTCVFGLENSGMCDCGKGFSGEARDAAKDEGGWGAGTSSRMTDAQKVAYISKQLGRDAAKEPRNLRQDPLTGLTLDE